MGAIKGNTGQMTAAIGASPAESRWSDAELLDRVAPDLRIPLVSVLGSLELLRNGSLGDLHPYQQRILSVASKNAQQLATMLEDVFMLANLDAGTFTLLRTETDLAEVVTTSCALVQSLYADHEHEWHINTTGTDGLVMADTVQLQRALANVIMNAARFTPTHGKISVTVAREYGHHVVTISDNGIGIPEGELERLGDRFFRSSTSQRQSLDGMGLGFVVAKTIFEHHDGVVAVDSSTNGTCVQVSLPYIPVDDRLSA